jgi:hypothetical protein
VANIVVATDGSGGPSRAVEVAAELAKALECDLLIVAVADRLLGEEIRQLAHSEVRACAAAANWAACCLAASRISLLASLLARS